MFQQRPPNQSKRFQRFSLLLAVVIIAGIGTYLLTSSHAASSYASITADKGALANGATSQTCAGASNGNCVVFEGASITGKDEGKPQVRQDMSSYWDASCCTASTASFVKSHIARGLAYPSFGDKYVGLYGIPILGYHDPNGPGSPIDMSTSAGLNTELNWVTTDLNNGYAGTFMDDVNWTSAFQPFHNSPATLANAIAQIRAQHPNAVIEANSQYNNIWPIMQNPSDPAYPYVESVLSHVNIVTKEFGVGPTAGINSASAYASFMQYIDTLHSKNVHTTMTGDHNSSTAATMMYNEATYFLINDGGDFINGSGQLPSNWWPGFNVNLGNATSARSRSASGIWTRSFVNGVVYTVEPGAATQTIVPPAGAKDVNGNSITSVTLSPASGVVLTK